MATLGNQLLEVLRGQLKPSKILAANELVAITLARLPTLRNFKGDELAQQIGLLLRDAISDVRPANLVPLVEIMVGVQGPGRAPLNTRSEVLDELGRRYPRQRGEGPLGPRQVENKEAIELAPAVERSLRRLLKGGESVAPPFREYRLRLQARMHPTEKSAFVLRTEVTARVVLAQLRVLVTTDESLALGVCMSHPTLFESYVPATDLDEHKLLSAAVEDDEGGLVKVPLTALTDSEIQKFAPELVRSDIRVIAAQPLSRNVQSRRVQLITDQVLRLDEHWCYWSAPRTLELERIDVDFSSLAAHSRDIELTPLFGTPPNVTGDDSGYSWWLEPRQWLSPGNALLIHWRELP